MAEGSGPGLRTDHVELSPPLVVRTIPASALSQKNAFEHATVTGWRYLAPHSDTMVDYDSDGNRTGTISTGPILQNLEKAVQLASDEFANKPENFQVGILEIPALRAAALTIEGDKVGNRKQLYFIPYKDPRPNQEIKLATVNGFARQLADILGIIAPGNKNTSNLQRVESVELAPVKSAGSRQTAAAATFGSRSLERLGEAVPIVVGALKIAAVAGAAAVALRIARSTSERE